MGKVLSITQLFDPSLPLRALIHGGYLINSLYIISDQRCDGKKERFISAVSKI